jgi:hypothetical protein
MSLREFISDENIVALSGMQKRVHEKLDELKKEDELVKTKILDESTSDSCGNSLSSSSESCDGDKERLEIKERQCKFYRSFDYREYENHTFIGRAYQCEACGQDGCKHCLYRDCWEERCKDNVFLCRSCRRVSQIVSDCG